MLKWLLQIAFISTSFCSLTQQADYLLQTSSYNDVNVRTIDRTNNGELIAGLDLDYSTAGICKISTSGTIDWAKDLSFSGGSASCSYDIIERANGNYYLHGLVMINGAQHAFLAEVTPAGSVVFAKNYFLSNTLVYYINKVKVADNGDLVFMGSYDDNIYVFRTDANGIFLWGKTFSNDPGNGGKNPGFDLELVEGGSIIVLGQHTDALTLIRLDPNGNLVFSRKHTIGVFIQPQEMLLVNNQNLYISGVFSTDSITPNSNLSLIKVDASNGIIDWVKSVQGTKPSASVRQRLTLSNGAIKHTFVGLDSLQSNLYQFVAEYSLNGIVTAGWTGNDFSGGNDYNSVDVINGFEYYFGGITTNSGTNNTGWIYEPDSGVNCFLSWYPLSSQTYTDFQDVPSSLIETPFSTGSDISMILSDIPMNVQSYCQLLATPELSYEAIRIVPNPTQGVVTISNFNEAAIIQLLDLNGTVILSESTTLDQITIDLESFESGVYLIQITSESHQLTRKVQKL